MELVLKEMKTWFCPVREQKHFFHVIIKNNFNKGKSRRRILHKIIIFRYNDRPLLNTTKRCRTEQR